MLTVKCGRNEFELNETDEIMYNGACYQITTRKIHKGIWNNWTYPVIPKLKAERLIKNGMLVLDRNEKKHLTNVEIYKVNTNGECK